MVAALATNLQQHHIFVIYTEYTNKICLNQPRVRMKNRKCAVYAINNNISVISGRMSGLNQG